MILTELFQFVTVAFASYIGKLELAVVSIDMNVIEGLGFGLLIGIYSIDE